jgi:uncharacterized metal-binding protein YceD (DUF177 family)
MKASPFSHQVLAGDVPAEGRRYRVEADAEERRLLAEALGIPEILALAAELEVRPVRGRSFSVRGTFSAAVVQTDVVTLDPVTQDVAEEIDVMLMPAEGAGPRPRQREILVDAVQADAPDVYHNGRIDLGVIVAEHLALGLDPYPRAPGVDFPGHVEDDAAEDPSPFAVLAKLKGQDR